MDEAALYAEVGSLLLAECASGKSTLDCAYVQLYGEELEQQPQPALKRTASLLPASGRFQAPRQTASCPNPGPGMS